MNVAPWFPSHTPNSQQPEEFMAPMTRAQRREYYAKHRCLQKYRERLQREPARAQRYLQALEQALVDVGVAETVAEEVQWQLKAVRKRLCRKFSFECDQNSWTAG
jgi:hypothetical protein